MLPSPPTHDTPKITILVVDDSRELHHLLKLAFDFDSPYRFVHAFNGKEGLALLQAIEPDLILLDMHMPEMDGLEMLRQLQEQEHHPIPIIFMSGMGTEMLATQAFRLGVQHYLVKPFSLDELTEQIEDVLREVRLAQEKEVLGRQLLMAEATRSTVVALSHHINNRLQIAVNAMNLLEESLQQGNYWAQRKMLLEMAAMGQENLGEIGGILRVLERVTAVQNTDYDSDTAMLDVATALNEAVQMWIKK